jgi:hypothetical protein
LVTTLPGLLAINEWIKLEPIKPAPPVTRIDEGANVTEIFSFKE